jgi:hypothetical protein
MECSDSIIDFEKLERSLRIISQTIAITIFIESFFILFFNTNFGIFSMECVISVQINNISNEAAFAGDLCHDVFIKNYFTECNKNLCNVLYIK